MVRACRAFGAVLMLVSLAVSCSGSPTGVVSRDPIALVVVNPERATLENGATVPLTALALDTAGNPHSGRQIYWASSDERIATVNSSGVVTGRAPGEARIAASAEGKSAIATVTVIVPPVASVQVTPSQRELVVEETVQLSASARHADGRALEDRQVSWSTSAGSVATVSSTGLVTARAPGTATITATSEGKSGTATITVRPIPVATVAVAPASSTLDEGASQQLQATLRDAQGRQLTGRAIIWSSNRTSVATVDGNGLVRAVGVGTATITATSEGRSGTASVTVRPAPVSRVTVTSPVTQIRVGETTTLAARTYDASNRELQGRAITWSSSSTTTATVDGTGRVTAHQAGNVTITATSEGRSGNVSLTVLPPAVASVTVQPGSATLEVGATVRLTATLRASDGSILSGRVVIWRSSNPSVATVDGSGLVRAVASGSATISATSEGQDGFASITVGSNTPLPPPPPPPPPGVHRVEIVPSSITLSARNNQTAQLELRAYDASGNRVQVSSVTWRSSNVTVAAVSRTGIVMAIRPGNAVITGEAEGKSATAAVTVNNAP